MKNKKRILSILSGFLIGVLAYWLQPYNENAVFGVSIWLILGLGSFIASFILIMIFKKKPYLIALIVSLGIVLAVLARIIYDIIFFDSTSHNLAPLEILITSIVSIPSAIIGVYLGALFKKLFK